MAKIIDLGEHHVGRRYVVSGIKARAKEFMHEQDAYSHFFTVERSEWRRSSEEKMIRKKMLTLDKAIDFYFGYRCKQYNRNEISRNTFRKYQSSFKAKHEFNQSINAPISSLQEDDIEDLNLNKARRSFVVELMNFAVKNNIISVNALSELKPIFEKKEAKFATQYQVDRLLSETLETGSYRLHLFVFLASNLGLRLREVCGLTWDSIDKNKIHITKQRADDGSISKCKGRKSRSLNIDFGRLIGVLLLFDSKATEKIGTSSYIFGVSGTQVKKDFFKLKERLGFDITPHSLRHYCASNWIMERNFSILAVSKALGHASTSVTLDIYGHLLHEKDEVRM